jgi:hypothetical protein
MTDETISGKDCMSYGLISNAEDSKRIHHFVSQVVPETNSECVCIAVL